MSTVIPKEIHPGIMFLRKVNSATEQELSIQNKLMNVLEFTVSFAGSTNIKILNSESLVASVTVDPDQTKHLATISMTGTWELKQSFRFAMKPPPKEIADRLISENKQQLQSKIAASRQLISKRSIDRITRRRVAASTGNFTDPFFPPYHDSIFRGAKDARLNAAVVWRRPSEFFRGPFDIFVDNIEPNDIKQGMLGDCWLMCALSSLAERPELVRRLFVTTKANQEGIYRVRLCKDGEWITVTVDDYFPCFPEGMPIFSRSQGNELWVLLLEKAIAKVNGSYMLLRGGWAYEGMSDLTGCPTECYDFDDQDVKAMIRREEFWPILESADVDGCLISASTSGEDRWTETGKPTQKGGLVPGHAYTVISVKEAYGFKLINIRNPWGTFEWDGNWCDTSPLWTPRMKAAINPVLDSNDGTFWMSYDDFIIHFSGVNICWVRDYEEARMKGLFIRETVGEYSKVVAKNYYTVKPTANAKVYFGIHQNDERIFGAADKMSYLDIGIVVLKVLPNGRFEYVARKQASIDRQAELVVELDAGVSYIVVPRTSGCSMQRPANAPQESNKLIEAGEMNPLFLVTLLDLFKKFNVNLSNYLSELQLKKLFELAGVIVTDDDIAHISENYACTRNGLSLDGFIQYMHDQTIQFGETTMWSWLNSWGYDRDFYSIGARRFVFTIHSTEHLQVHMRKQIGSGMSLLVDQMLLQNFGVQKSQMKNVRLYCLYEAKANAFIYGVYNTGTTPCEVEFDASRSQGVVYGLGTSMTRAVVKANSWEVLNYFQIAKDSTNCKICPQLRFR